MCLREQRLNSLGMCLIRFDLSSFFAICKLVSSAKSSTDKRL